MFHAFVFVPRKVVWIALAALVIAALVFFLLSRSRKDASLQAEMPLVPRGEGTVAYPEEPASFDPYSYAGDSTATRDLLRPVLPTLFTTDPSLRMQPLAASSTRLEGDGGFSVRVEINPQAVWSDGKPITADDVRFTWQWITSRGADRSGYDRITDVEVIDARTARLRFDRPYSAWKELFSAGDFILPRHSLEGKDPAALDGGPAVSGGPFMIESRTPGLEIVYKANPRWWGRGPGLERVRVQFVPDVQTALQLLGMKRVDLVTSTSQIGLERRLQRLDGVRQESKFGRAWWELGFQTKKPGPEATGFRRAVAHGFDRAGFAEALLKEDGRILNDAVPGSKEDAFTRYRFDQPAARSRLAEAGLREQGGIFREGATSTFGISGPAESELVSVIQKSLQTGLKAAGLQVEPRNPRGDVFYSETRRAGDFDMTLWERRGTPSTPLGGSYRSNYVPDQGVNYSRIQSDRLDQALDTAGDEPTPDEAASASVMQTVAEEIPVLPLFEVKAYIGYRNLVGPRANATIDGPFWNLWEWRRGS